MDSILEQIEVDQIITCLYPVDHQQYFYQYTVF